MDINNAVRKVIKKAWQYVYVPAVKDGVVTLSDRTKYSVQQPSGSLIRMSRKPTPQHVRRRLVGKIRRSMGLTRSEFDTYNNSLK